MLAAGRGGSNGNATAGSSSTPGGEGGGAPEPSPGEQLGVCLRLEDVTSSLRAVNKQFEGAVFDDCRVKWLVYEYLKANARDDYRNDLDAWSKGFWGCAGALPVLDFKLIYGTPPFSQADSDIVIEAYMTAAIDGLMLSSKEQTDMRAALERLATDVVTSDSSEPSQAACEDGSGGAGGAGADGGASGLPQGGAAGTSAGGATGGSDDMGASGRGELP